MISAPSAPLKGVEWCSGACSFSPEINANKRASIYRRSPPVDTPNPASPLFIPAPCPCLDRWLSASASTPSHINWGRYFFNATLFFYFKDSFWKKGEKIGLSVAWREGEKITWTIIKHFPFFQFLLFVLFSFSCSLWPAAKKSKQQCPPASVSTAIIAKTPCWGRST